MDLGGPLRLALLGHFSLMRGDLEIEIAARGQRLIALLALRDCPVTRQHVAGNLWPEYSTERALADLRTTLWRVNKSDERIVTGTTARLGLCADIDVDVRRLITFAQRLGEASDEPVPVELESIELSELSRDLLPDWYDTWLQDEREKLRQTRLHALETLARALSAAGRHAVAIQAALAAIRLDPLRETAHRTLIETHLAEGNWSEAIRQFQRCRRLLREELGVEPSESMRRLLKDWAGLAPRTATPRRAVASH